MNLITYSRTLQLLTQPFPYDKKQVFPSAMTACFIADRDIWALETNCTRKLSVSALQAASAFQLWRELLLFQQIYDKDKDGQRQLTEFLMGFM